MHSLRVIVFVRHSESHKSVQDRHGGEGEPLTELGKVHTHLVADFLLQQCAVAVPSSMAVYSPKLPQTAETSTILAERLRVPLLFDDRLRNIHLGVLSGLSAEEARSKYPAAATQLEDWRQGKIPIDKVSIPHAESMRDFHFRVSSFLGELFDHADWDTVVIVGTRSVGVMTTNILLGCHRYSAEGYRRYLFDPGSVTWFEIVGRCLARPRFMNYTGFLTTPSAHPDR